jgi:glycosyltransferase involved in cell wall biosynthesis
MNIAFFANPHGIHDCKWINEFSKNHKCIIICSENTIKDKCLNNIEVPIFPILPNIFPIQKLGLLKQTKVSLQKILRVHNIDLCHSMYAYPYAIWANAVNFDKHIITTRGSDVLIDLEKTLNSGRNLKEKLIHFLLKKKLIKSFNQAKFITSTSLQQSITLKKYVHDHSKLRIIPTGLDLEKIDGFISTANQDKLYDVPFIFSPRSMSPIYQIELIINAFKLLIEKYPNYKLILIDDRGKYDYSDSILKIVKELDITEKVVFVHSLSLQKMIQHYVQSDLAVMVPKSDGTPNSGLEAMYCETPLILGNLPYDDNLFDPNYIYRLYDNTTNKLFKKLVEVIEDPSKNSKLKKGKQIIINKANLNSSIESINKLYLHQD